MDIQPLSIGVLASLRTAVYVTLIGVSLSPGMAVGDEEETGVPEGFAIFVHGDEPGHLEIDGSNLNAMLQLPEEPRHFYSADEFVEFAIQELNASVVLDELGIPVGVEGFLTVTDTLLTVDPATHEILEVKDPIAAFLGGQFGYFFIGEEKVCLDPQETAAKNNSLTQVSSRAPHLHSRACFSSLPLRPTASAVYRRTSTCCSTRPSAPRRTKRKAAGRSRPTFVGNGDSFPGSAARPAGGMSSG